MGQVDSASMILASEQDNFHRLRQSGIDEELFDLISGFEALSSGQHGPITWKCRDE